MDVDGMNSPRAIEDARAVIIERLKIVRGMENNADGVEVNSNTLIYALFNDANSSAAAMWISNLINIVIMASTVGFIAETDATLRGPEYTRLWFSIECACVGLFTVDFVVRAVTCPEFKEFRSDIMNGVDFVAIVPFYIELAFKVLDLDAGALSNLRVIRVLRLARVLKIIAKSNDGPSIDEGDGDEDVGAVISEIVSNSGGALIIPLYFMLLSLIVFASLQYYVEKVNPILIVHICTDWNATLKFPDNCKADFCEVNRDMAQVPAVTPDYSSCTHEVPHSPFESPCPQSKWQGEVQMAHEGTIQLGHPCTVTSMVFPGDADTEAGFVPEFRKGTEIAWEEGDYVDCSMFSGDHYKKLGSCRIGQYWEYPDKPLGEPQGSVMATTDSDMFPSIPHAMWWCIVTMTTVGYGDKYPISWLGQVIGVATASMGIFFISMPLAIVGSSFANSCDKLQNVADQKDAVKASEGIGYGSLSFLSKSHAPILMAHFELDKIMKEIQNIVEEDVGIFDKDESGDVIDLIFDLREKQTVFSKMLHKELFLGRVKRNMSAFEKGDLKEESVKSQPAVAMDLE